VAGPRAIRSRVNGRRLGESREVETKLKKPHYGISNMKKAEARREGIGRGERLEGGKRVKEESRRKLNNHDRV
jgi:hypothetical protein